MVGGAREAFAGVPVHLGPGTHQPAPTACLAPSHELYLHPNGDVRSCCRSLASLGNVKESSLSAIWNGRPRAELVGRLARDDYSGGCQSCETEVTLEGREGSFSATFDHWQVDADTEPRWPSRMEFNLSNTCNLQCVQCSGELSSSIRIHREKRPPLQPAYGDAFFEDLRQFIPHLSSAGFAGGEPFLGTENYRVWEMMAELAPTIPCTIVTNGTQWNRRVEQVLDALAVHPVVSIDSPTRQGYERIRVGGEFEVVVANIERLRDYHRAAGTTMSLNFCLMSDNVLEFPDMLQFAESRQLHLNVCVVRSPVQHSLARMAPSELAVIHRQLKNRSSEMERSLQLNLDRWRIELERIGHWANPNGEDRSHWTQLSPMIMMFPRQLPRRSGATPGDRNEVTLDPRPDDDVFTLDIGPDDLVSTAPPGLAEALGLPTGALDGQTLAAVMPAMRRYRPLESDEHVYLAEFDAVGRSGQVLMVPRRDSSGLADSVQVTFVLGPRRDT